MGSLDGGARSFYNSPACDSSVGDSKLMQLLEKLSGSEGGSRDAEQQERSQPTLLQRIVATRVHMVVLAALVQWLLVSEYGFMFGEVRKKLIPFTHNKQDFIIITLC
ncbi:hypothetical protein PR048_006701 [Dryococelus australis]|uniref:Uncharacterized protein n=1 Tax=Dryococelus australis TaxID=614101 RepID=A0ABQ9IBR9_9NEOP|nr:hypothetical protein PR048_006701 [Dryococelus australis]